METARDSQAELAAALEAARRRQAELSAKLESARGAQSESTTARETDRRRLAELSNELEAAQARENALKAEVESSRSRYEELQQEVAAGAECIEGEGHALEELRAERDRLLDRLAEAEHRLAEAPKAACGNEDYEDMRRRHEMALDDLRDLKAENAELKKQLSEGHAGGASGGATVGGAMDWESQKRRFLAALEAESGDEQEGEEAEQRAAERVKMGQVICSTGEALDAKDRELEEMRQLLENQSESLGSVAVGAAALGKVFDQDEIIRQQRETLKRLEEEWKAKLRQAEIEISVERAKIARQRAEVDEKTRAFNESGGREKAEADKAKQPAKPVRGRWLARLGLNDGEKG